MTASLSPAIRSSTRPRSPVSPCLIEKVPGARVFAGTIDQSGTLDVRTTGIGRDTTFAKIVEAVEQAEKSRAPIQKTADRLAGYLVYFALAAAALTFLLTRDARATISVIIVAGACGVAAGTPLAILGAVGRSARAGAIVKGGIHIETLGRVDTIVLDKTGTLTLGAPRVVGLHPAEGISPAQLLEAAAIAELPSEHPLGKAVLAKAKEEGIMPAPPERFAYTPGKGIVCVSDDDTIVVGNRSLLEREAVAITRLAECPLNGPRGARRHLPRRTRSRGRSPARGSRRDSRDPSFGHAHRPADRRRRVRAARAGVLPRRRRTPHASRMTETETKWSERVRRAGGQRRSSRKAASSSRRRLCTGRVACGRATAGAPRAKRKREPHIRMVRVVPAATRAEESIVIAVGDARVAVRAGFDPVLLRQVVTALGAAR